MLTHTTSENWAKGKVHVRDLDQFDFGVAFDESQPLLDIDVAGRITQNGMVLQLSENQRTRLLSSVPVSDEPI